MTKRLSALLTAAILLCLCACSGTTSDGAHPEQPDSGKSAGESTELGVSEKTGTTLSPGLAYVADCRPIESGAYSLTPRLYTADGIYCTASEKAMQTLSEGGGLQDAYRTVLYLIGYDGQKHTLPAFQALDPAECAQVLPEGAHELVQSSEIQAVLDCGDGRLVLLENVITSYHDASAQETEPYGDDTGSLETLFLRVIDKTGAEESCNVLDIPGYENGAAINGVVYDGRLVCAAGNTVAVFGLDGCCQYALDSRSWFDRILVLDGKLYALASFDERTELIEVDLNGRTFGAKQSLSLNGWDFTVGGGDYDVYSNTGAGLFGCELESGRSGEVLSWLSCGVNGYELSSYTVRSDGTIVTVRNSWDKSCTVCENSVLVLHTGAYEAAPQELVLTLACKHLSEQLAQAVNDFNRSNAGCRIEVTDYSQYNSENDWNAGMIRLNTEIMAGKAPDIIVLDGLPAKQYAAKGILADLYPFLEEDPELDRGDFFESILKACENEGKLYTTVSGFSIDTCIGASGVVGDEPGWNYKQFADALASMPEGCTPFNRYTTRELVLSYLLALELDRFVDWNTGACSFDSPAFLDLLAFAATFPESGYGGDGWTLEDAEPNRIASGRQMLMRNGIYCFSDFQLYDAMFGGDCTYIGYPTSCGTGNMIQLDSGCAISATCKAPEAAWKFVRTFFTAEYQRDLEWSLPSNREVFREKLSRIMTPVYLQDENGGYVLDENGDRIETEQGSMKYGDATVGYRALTAAQAEKIMALVESTQRRYDYDESIASIVTDEAAAFFGGQKSVEAVAKLIQSRVFLYLSEQS